MKYLFALILFTSVPAAAMEWHVYLSTDPSDGRNTQEVSTSTGSFRFNLAGATTKCEVTPVVTVDVPPFYTLSGRYLTCEFLEGSIVAQFTGCLNEEEQHSLNVLYMHNLNKMYQLSVQCLNTKEKERYPNEPEDKSYVK